MAKMKWYGWLTYFLVAIGAINWGLVGLFNFNLVETLLGSGMITTIVYGLVGASGVYALFLAKKLK